MPAGNKSRLHLRPKSNLSSLVSSQIRSRRGSKLKISLKIPVSKDDKLRYSTPQSLLTESKNLTTLSEKTKQAIFGKRSVSKHLKKRSKTKLCFSDKRDTPKLQKFRKQSSNISNSRVSVLKKKRKESQSKMITNADIFKSVDIRKKKELYNKKRSIRSNLSKYDPSNLTISHHAQMTSIGMHDFPSAI